MTTKKTTAPQAPAPSGRTFTAVGVTLAEISEVTGRPPLDIEAEAVALGMPVYSDWADRPVLAAHDARALVTGEAQRIKEHEAAWRQHLAACELWTRRRDQTVRDAQEAVMSSAERRGQSRPAGEALAREEALKVGAAFERDNPVPLWHGQDMQIVVPHYLADDERRGVLARLGVTR